MPNKTKDIHLTIRMYTNTDIILKVLTLMGTWTIQTEHGTPAFQYIRFGQIA